MKFGKYLESKARPEWRAHYLDYKALKELIKQCMNDTHDTPEIAKYSPRTTSLTVVRFANKKDTHEERFFTKLESDVRV